MRTTTVLSLVLTLFVAGCIRQAQPIDPSVKAGLVEYINTHYQTPEEYVLSKFGDHDIVYLGEYHRIKHDPEFVQTLIPLLHRSGVYCLGLEFARRREQQLIDSVLQAPAYNESLAHLILFKNFVFWGYKEYADIFKAAWRLNHSLPAGTRPFRILGLNNSPDWSFVKAPGDQDKGSVMSKVWHGETEENWAQVLDEVVISRGEKALVYCGINHAFTQYRQPVAVDGKFIRFGDTRAGNAVFERIGKRSATIYLHAPWPSVEGYDQPFVRAADGYIDALLEALDPEYRRVGFDTRNTPFADLPGETSIYKFGYERFTLATIVDGYVCQGPLSGYQGVTPVENFINESNLEEARAQSPNPGLRAASILELNKAISNDANIPRKFSRLK